MKKALVLTIGMLLVGGFGYAEITGSSHDLDGATYGGTEICKFCHIPHNANATFAAPLWNHDVTAVTNYNVYSSSTMNQGGAPQPGDISLACLSCHDGTVAVNAYGGGGAGDVSINTGWNSYLGTDLGNDHPVGVNLATAISNGDAELHANPTTAILFANVVECASCHDVHNNAYTTYRMLIMDNTGSALCLDCHDK